MIRLELSGVQKQVREEFREWLAANPPPRVADDSSLDAFQRIGKAWQSTLSEGGWVAVHWPSQYRGRDLSLVEQAIVQEELVSSQAPQILGLFGLSMVGPVLIRFGSDEQKSQHLAPILNASKVWCQGFSEPGAGSDLAAVSTRAEKADGGFLVNGQKTWTSFAHVADWCFLLCRTGKDGSRYSQLSYLLVDMKSPGIRTRPLAQATGDEEFNEVFFDNVFVPDENVVGKVGQGWEIAISTLMHERVILTFARQLQSERLLQHALQSDSSDARGLLEKRALVREVVEACGVRALAYKHLFQYASGTEPGSEGSLDKLGWSESFQRLTRHLFRSEGLESLWQTSEAQRYLYSRGRTLAAGTSEIQRNIIAERVLGLPRLHVKYGEGKS